VLENYNTAAVRSLHILVTFSFYLRVFALSLAHGVLVSLRGYGGAYFCGSRVLLSWYFFGCLPFGSLWRCIRDTASMLGLPTGYIIGSHRRLYAWSAEKRSRMGEKVLVSVAANLPTRMNSQDLKHTARITIIRRRAFPSTQTLSEFLDRQPRWAPCPRCPVFG
jgi:hypothetical protein